MQYFFDTSAIVKLYHQEMGSDRVLPLYRDGEAIVISEIGEDHRVPRSRVVNSTVEPPQANPCQK